MTTKRKKTPVKPVKAKPVSSTALVRRAVDRVIRQLTPLLPQRVKAEVLPPVSAPESMTLGEDAMLGALGLVEVKLTPAEEAVLSQPVKIAEMLIKPTGQPYLSHPSYTRWFNEAFGRLGWSLIPRSKPMVNRGQGAKASVVCPYVLYIHGQPAAFAIGEQDYYEDNPEQTYGDALEATVASALRRCAKRLGVGLELWDKVFLERFIAEHCAIVRCSGKNKPQYRLKTAPRFYDEVGPWNDTSTSSTSATTYTRTEPRSVPLAGHDGHGADVISDKQGKRLWSIMSTARRSETDVKAWLKARYGLASTKDIPRHLYDEICAWVEQRGPLPPKE